MGDCMRAESSAIPKELHRRGIGARRLDLVFVRVDNIAQAARIGLGTYSQGDLVQEQTADRA